jgi:hypothetical protein
MSSQRPATAESFELVAGIATQVEGRFASTSFSISTVNFAHSLRSFRIGYGDRIRLLSRRAVYSHGWSAFGRSRGTLQSEALATTGTRCGWALKR